MRFTPVKKPFDHQRKGLVWLWQKTKGDGIGSKGGGFFWDPGTGKTKSAYDFISAAYLDRGLRRVLVLGPLNAIQVWDDQADKHIVEEIPFSVHMPQGKIVDKAQEVHELTEKAVGHDDLTILVLNFAAIIKRDPKWLIMKALKAYKPDIVIVDESHHIKNGSAKQSKATHLICSVARYVLIQTGTPIGKNYLDLYSQMKAIDPKIWQASWSRTGAMSWSEFKNHYGVWGGRTGYELRGYNNVQDLEERYQPHITSVRKEDCHDMPKVTDMVIPVELDPAVAKAYDLFAEDGLIVWKRHLIEAPIPLTKLLRLQQMTGGWVHDEQGDSVHIHNRKVEALEAEIEELASAGRSVVVFARFLSEIEAIKTSLNKFYGMVGSIQGGVSAARRTALIKEFNRRPTDGSMVINVASAEALDGLQTTCSDGIFYSTDYSLIHWNQARGRLDRTGQRTPVVFRHLQVKGSVDGLILDALKSKKDIERMVMDNPEVMIIRR